MRDGNRRSLFSVALVALAAMVVTIGCNKPADAAGSASASNSDVSVEREAPASSGSTLIATRSNQSLASRPAAAANEGASVEYVEEAEGTASATAASRNHGENEIQFPCFQFRLRRVPNFCEVALQYCIEPEQGQGEVEWLPLPIVRCNQGAFEGNRILRCRPYLNCAVWWDCRVLPRPCHVRIRVLCRGVIFPPCRPIFVCPPVPQCDVRILPPNGPGVVVGANPNYAATITQGDSLNFSVTAREALLPLHFFGLRAELLGSLTPADIGFSLFEQQEFGVGQVTLNYAGVAIRPGTYQIRYTVLDRCPVVHQILHTITVLPRNRPPVIELPQQGLIRACERFALPFRAVDPDGDLVRLRIRRVGGTIPDADVVFNPTLPTSDQGVGSVGILLRGFVESPGTIRLQLQATDGQLTVDSFFDIFVDIGLPARLELTGLRNPTTCNDPDTVRVTIFDACDNIVTNYTGTVRFSSSDPQATLPADYTFQLSDNGTRLFPNGVIMRTAGPQTVTAFDIAQPTLLTDTDPTLVRPGPCVRLEISGIPARVGDCDILSPTVTAYDACGNIATGFRGTVRFASDDLRATLPADYTFQASDQGSHTYTNELILRSVGLTDLFVSEIGVPNPCRGQLLDIRVLPGPAVSMQMIVPINPVLACERVPVIIRLLDDCGNLAVNYTGTVGFRSSDPNAILPAPYQFQLADRGERLFLVEFQTAGLQTLQARDLLDASLADSQQVLVLAGLPAVVQVSGLANPSQCEVPQDLRVCIYDSCGNIVRRFAGVIVFTSTDPQATLPAPYQFDPLVDQGCHVFQGGVILRSAGVQQVCAHIARLPLICGCQEVEVVCPQGPFFEACPEGPDCVKIKERITLSWLTINNPDRVELNGQNVTGLNAVVVTPFPQDPQDVCPEQVYKWQAFKAGVTSDMADMFRRAWQIPGRNNQHIAKVAVFEDESYVNVGWFDGTTIFGPGEPNQTIAVPVGGQDLFIARYFANGLLDWVITVGTLSDERANDVDTMLNNDIIVAGDFNASITFGLGDPNQTTLPGNGRQAGFALRLTCEGELRWAKAMYATDQLSADSIARYKDGDVAITGFKEGRAIIGQGELLEEILPAIGGKDMWVARLCADGSLKWVRQGLDRLDDIGDAITTHYNGDLSVGGHFFGTLRLGAGEPNDTTHVADPTHGLEDGYIARYNCDGDLVWFKAIRGAYDAGTHGLVRMPDDGVAGTGYFQSRTFWGEGPNQMQKTSGGLRDTWVARYLPNGDLVWVEFHCNRLEARGRDICAWPDGTVAVIGDFHTELVLGLGETDETHIFDLEHDAYVATHAYADGDYLEVQQMGNRGRDEGHGVACFECGGYVAVGDFERLITMGQGTPQQQTLVSAQAFDGWIARYDFLNYMYFVARPEGYANVIPVRATNHQRAMVVAALKDGGRIVAGDFIGTVTFGPGEPNETTLVSVDRTDMYLAKYAKDESLVWVKHIPGLHIETPYGIDVTCDGDILLCGGFACTAVFGLGETDEVTIVDSGAPNEDPFLARYAPDGDFLWVERGHAPFGGDARKCAFLPDGNVAVVGSYEVALKLNFFETSEIVLGGFETSLQMFVAVYDPTGTVLWADDADFLTNRSTIHMSACCDGGFIVGGGFTNSSTFGEGTNEVTLVSNGSSDAFLLKYDENYDLEWAEKAGGPFADAGFATACSEVDGILYLGGIFSGTATFGQGTNQQVLNAPGNREMFVAAYDLLGNLLWVQALRNGAGDHTMQDMVALPNGGVALTGSYEGTLLINPGEPTQRSISSQGDHDVFLVAYKPDGKVLFAYTAGGRQFDTGTFVDAYADRGVVISGWYEGNMAFAFGEPNQEILLNHGQRDGFSARYYYSCPIRKLQLSTPGEPGELGEPEPQAAE